MFICRVFMYDILIASGDRTLTFPFVVHLQDVWRRVNGALFVSGRCLDSLLIHGMDAVLSSTHPILCTRRPLVLCVVPSPEGVSSLKSLLSQITVVGIFFINPSGTMLSVHNLLFARAVSCSSTAE